jgi:hypothetical protein
MPDLDQRVTTLEQEVADLKVRLGANEEDVRSIPDLIKIEFRLANSQNARLSRDVANIQRGLDDLAAKVEAFPRVIAEMFSERDRRR